MKIRIQIQITTSRSRKKRVMGLGWLLIFGGKKRKIEKREGEPFFNYLSEVAD